MFLYLKEFFKKYQYTSFLIVLVAFVLIYFLRAGNSLNLVFIIANISLIVLILIFLSRLKLLLLIPLSIILIVHLTIDLVFIKLYHTPILLGNIAAIIQTNSIEAMSFFNVRTLVTIAIILVLNVFFIFKSTFELKQIDISLNKILLLLSILIIIIPVVCFSHAYWESGERRYNNLKGLKNFPVHRVYADTSKRIPCIYGSAFGLFVYGYEKYQFYKSRTLQKKNPESVTYSSKFTYMPNIYLVIGESSCRNYHSLYGYDIKTTPFVDSLNLHHKNSILYYDAISVASLTIDFFKFSMSFATPFNPSAFYEEKNIVEMANHAGYYTMWFSNQYTGIMSDYTPSYISSSSDYKRIENGSEDDFLLLDYYEESIKDNTQKNFVAFHLKGSHLGYSDKYDNSDYQFFSSGINTSEYDMSIHHTDHFLKKLYTLVKRKDQSFIIIYVSDHGEIVNKGHGFINESVAQFEVPFLFIQSEEDTPFIETIVSKYVDEESKLINNLNCSYIISEMLGYKVENEAVKKAVENGRYIYHANGEIYLFEDLLKK